MFRKNTSELAIKTTLSVVLSISFVILGSFTCSKNYRTNSVELIIKFPARIYKEKNEIKVYHILDTVRIFYYEDYVLYRLPGRRIFETEEIIAGTEPYFIFNRKNTHGFLFTSLKDSSLPTKLQVDSFLANRGMKGKDFDLLPDSVWSLIGETNDKENSIVEKYVLIKPGDETSIDSISYYYTKTMDDVRYSFSKKLDSIKSMKLFRIRMVYNEKFDKHQNITLPQREIVFEFRKGINFDEKAEVTNLIKNFKKCCDRQ